jgi:predicted transposase/invertase (TIGR01784 family)
MMKRLLLTTLLGLCLSSNLISSGEAALSSSPSDEEHPAKRARMTQTYGIPTYDALFKYVLSQDSIRPSFFHAFVPGLTITSSRRLDEHMNPLQELQLLRDFIHRRDTAEAVDRISAVSGICLGSLNPDTSSFVKDEAATTFIHEMVGHFEDIKKAFPRARYDGTMDFVCSLDTGEYALVEMQVIPQDYWDRRALAYVAAFYGNQLRRGDKWEHNIKKVIGINILGGGKDDKVHWSDTPGQYVRLYKFQEQLHEMGSKRYIDGIELIQYSIMNAPEEDPASDREKKDWITFFKRGHRMTESQVQEQIQTPEVLQAFERAKFSSMPRGVKEDYDDEDSQYDRYSQHTAAEVAKGEAMGEKKGLLKAARAMKKRGKMTDTEIAADLGLAESEVSEIKVDDQES